MSVYICVCLCVNVPGHVWFLVCVCACWQGVDFDKSLYVNISCVFTCVSQICVFT